MTGLDPHLIARAGAVYFAVVVTAAAWLSRRPSSRMRTGALLASVWNLSSLLVVQIAAARLGWWRYEAEGGIFLGMPFDLLLAWSIAWGAAALLAFDGWPLPLAAACAFAIDLLLMPLCAPVVQLGPLWRVGDAIAVGVAFVPGQWLGRWTAHDERLAWRTTLQMIAFAIILCVALPAAALEADAAALPRGWDALSRRSVAEWTLFVQILAIPALLGVSAVQEFATRGRGTPVPFDPPKRLVTSGIYRYVRNPMQLSALLLLAAFSVLVDNGWLLGAAVMAHLYSVGLAGWDEDADLSARFGDAWRRYRSNVPRWRPRLRPWIDAGAPAASLYVAETCGMCSEVGGWFARRRPSGLNVVPASSSALPLTRITYAPGDGGAHESGVAGVARALEHLGLGWAIAGCALRLPIVRPLAQLIVDGSGGEARTPPVSPRADVARFDEGGVGCYVTPSEAPHGEAQEGTGDVADRGDRLSGRGAAVDLDRPLRSTGRAAIAIHRAR